MFSDTKPSATPEVKGLAGLALGFILVGTADHEAAGDMLTYLHDGIFNSDQLKYLKLKNLIVPVFGSYLINKLFYIYLIPLII